MCRTTATQAGRWALVLALSAALLLVFGASGLAEQPKGITEPQPKEWDDGLAEMLNKGKLDHVMQTDSNKSRKYKVFYELGGETSTIWIQKGSWWANFGGEKKDAIVLWTEVARLPEGTKPSPELLAKMVEMNTLFKNGFALLGMKGGTIYAQCPLFAHNLDSETFINHVSIMHKLRISYRKELAELIAPRTE